MSDWQIVIGLETHVQLNTASKLFSSSPARYSEKPNAQANELDFGLPGVLPVANREAVQKAIFFGTAIGAEVSLESEFARKHYFYPDLPKGYQISQFEHPIIIGGAIKVNAKKPFEVALVRAHLEEDAGKLTHNTPPGSSSVDLNRAGVPLLEIVSEPVMDSAQTACDYAKALRELVCWIDICDGNMQEGSIRFDVNISLRPDEKAPLGTRTETKNMNSFRFMEQAINYEVERQRAILEDGGTVEQETRLFDPASGETRSMRSKEEAEDYRYMPDPDLLPLRIEQKWVDEIAASLPELPSSCRSRLTSELGLSAYDATVLTASRESVAFFEETAAACGEPKAAANWINGDLAAMCKEHSLAVEQSPINPKRLAGLISKTLDNTISGSMAKELLARMWSSDESAADIIASEGLQQISDAGELEQIIQQLVDDNPKQAEQYRAGKHKLLGFFVGQAMKATSGRGDPKQLNELARKILG